MLTMRYPVVKLGLGGPRLGQVTDLDMDRLRGALQDVKAVYFTLSVSIQKEHEGDLRICSDAVGWAASTRDLTDYMDANACVDFLRYELEQAAQAQYTVEDPQADAGPQLAPTTSALQERVKSEIGGLATWPWVGVAAGLAIFGGVIWAATK